MYKKLNDTVCVMREQSFPGVRLYGITAIDRNFHYQNGHVSVEVRQLNWSSQLIQLNKLLVTVFYIGYDTIITKYY